MDEVDFNIQHGFFIDDLIDLLNAKKICFDKDYLELEL